MGVPTLPVLPDGQEAMTSTPPVNALTPTFTPMDLLLDLPGADASAVVELITLPLPEVNREIIDSSKAL